MITHLEIPGYFFVSNSSEFNAKDKTQVNNEQNLNEYFSKKFQIPIEEFVTIENHVPHMSKWSTYVSNEYKAQIKDWQDSIFEMMELLNRLDNLDLLES